MNWKDLFTYDSGSLVWKESRGRIKAGSEAGTPDKDGYLCTQYNKKKYKNHRIVWEMFNGTIPQNLEIDHINHKRSDNRIENLRLVDRVGNGRNQSKARDVSYHKASGKWQARISSPEGRIHLGLFETEELALDSHRKARDIYYKLEE